MKKLLFLVAVASIAFGTLPISGQKSVEAFRKGFDTIKERLPKLLEEQCKNIIKDPPPGTVLLRDLVSSAEIMRLLNEKEAKISITCKGRIYYVDIIFEDKFDMYLSYFDGCWTVSKWEATWNRENQDANKSIVDWVKRIHYFAHKVVLLVDKITEK